MHNPSGVAKNSTPEKQSQEDLFLRTVLGSLGPYGVHLYNGPVTVVYISLSHPSGYPSTKAFVGLFICLSKPAS